LIIFCRVPFMSIPELYRWVVFVFDRGDAGEHTKRYQKVL
jgi:hypothetical protein